MDSKSKFLIIFVVLLFVALLILGILVSEIAYYMIFGIPIVGLIIFYVWRKNKSKGENLMKFDLNMTQEVNKIELTEANKHGRGKEKKVELPLFSFVSVSAATNNFSSANKLGEGGFGPVYKGVLAEGDEIAVKRLSTRSAQGLKELKNEILVIAKVQHKNLVKLLGCCIDKDEKMLIYDYMPNKSLDFFLFDRTKRKLLNWGTRVQIIEGVAQGILYLHEHSRVRIIHRDLKASNILLDKDMNPKISDFGIARIMFGENELQASTKIIVGTYGYMSPEYASEGLFSIKSDVFSFGVLMLEIMSGKKSTGFNRANCPNLLDYAWVLWSNNKVLNLIDPILEASASSHILLRYVNIALLCVQERPEDRPTMSDIVSMLTNEVAVASLLPPIRSAFSNARNIDSSGLSTNRSENSSINEVSISILEAR